MSNSSLDINLILNSLRLSNTRPSPTLETFLEKTIEQVRPYDGNWNFSWLLSDWDAPVWETNAGKKTRRDANGNWIQSMKTYWNVKLPDGRLLTDPEYKVLLQTCRELSALYRSGFADGAFPSLRVWSRFTSRLISLSYWLVLDSTRYKPIEYGFKLLDQAGVERIYRSIFKGGWSEVMALIPRCLSQFHEQIFQEKLPEEYLNDPFNLPCEYRKKVVQWLISENAYANPKGVKLGHVSRAYIGKLISVNTKSLFNQFQFSLFLRQFEQPKDEKLFTGNWSLREFPTQNDRLVEDAEGREFTACVDDLTAALRTMLKLYRHLPDKVPSPATLYLKRIISAIHSQSSTKSHTPFIPIDTALKYLKESLRWIVNYGDDLIDFYLIALRELVPKFALVSGNAGSRISANSSLEKHFKTLPLPNSLADAGFKFKNFSPTPGTTYNFERLRKSPSLDEALSILIGSITIVISMMKPARDSEITSLPLLCLIQTDDGRYWLDTDLAKRSKLEQKTKIGGRPIPLIAARAIQQMQKLNRGLSEIFDEKDMHRKNLLFYIPNASKWGAPMQMSVTVLNAYLDIFCDFVGQPPDEYGRRWYIRIHEMRKWFLLLLFWSGRYDVLDAARWIAGHTDSEHLYAYIEREFPDGKLGKLEAECAVDQLAKYDKTRVLLDDENIELVDLYERVLAHFNVESLNMVKEIEWSRFVEELFEDEYHLEPYSIATEDHQQRICIAIRVGPRRGSENDK